MNEKTLTHITSFFIGLLFGYYSYHFPILPKYLFSEDKKQELLLFFIKNYWWLIIIFFAIGYLLTWGIFSYLDKRLKSGNQIYARGIFILKSGSIFLIVLLFFLQTLNVNNSGISLNVNNSEISQNYNSLCNWNCSCSEACIMNGYSSGECTSWATSSRSPKEKCLSLGTKYIPEGIDCSPSTNNGQGGPGLVCCCK